jgi:hypothetical protein
VVGAVRVRLIRLPAATVTFHRAVLHREAVVVPPIDPEPLRQVRAAIRQGIADVWADDRVPEGTGYRPHVSTAYFNAPEDPAHVRRLLDQVQAQPVTVTLHAASLIVMHRDRRMYAWTTTATAPIGS